MSRLLALGWILFALSLFPETRKTGTASATLIEPVPFTAVRLTDSFWAPRLETIRRTTIRHLLQKCEETGRIRNFELAAAALAGNKNDRYCSKYPFDDSDVYKTIEAAAYLLQTQSDPELEKSIDGVIDTIAAAQEPDGYLYTARTYGGPPPQEWQGKERWSNLSLSHELYDIGHLLEAAIAYRQATGKEKLLATAKKSIELILKEFGPGRRNSPPGHQEIEIGLLKLYRLTREPKYLKLAQFFLDARGQTDGRESYGEYSQDHRPVAAQEEAVGHAVRAGYMYTAMAEVAALTRNEAYINALEKIWKDVVGRKIYLTGGVGATGNWEGYGPAFYLPNESAYAETCAAISVFLWNQRMFLLHGDSRYIDVAERILCNGLLSGISLEGDRFFYANPLASFGKHERVPWFSCACCPPNVARLIASIAGYLYAVAGEEVYVNLFAQSQARLQLPETVLHLGQTTRYPWQGAVTLAVGPEQPSDFTLKIRIPGWSLGRPIPSDLYRYENGKAEAPRIRVNGKAAARIMANGYWSIRRVWRRGDKVEIELPMPVRHVHALDAVEANRGRVAVERGPLVYCAEWPDNDGRVSNLVLPRTVRLRTEWRSDLLAGIMLIHGDAVADPHPTDESIVRIRRLTLVPYYAWAHRGPGEMTVWLAERNE